MTEVTLFLDTETTGVQDLYRLEPKKQFRLGQWAWGRNGDVHVTDDYDTFMHEVSKARYLCGHNLFYDTTVMWGKKSTIPLEMALDKRLIDTYYWYFLRHRIPVKYETRDGKSATTYQDGKQKPALVRRYLSLDNLTFQHDLPGKAGDLKALAKKYNPPKTLARDMNFGLIPTDDPDFVEYAKQDIVALQALASYLMDQGPITEYEWREMLVMAINNQMTKNGFRVDREKAQARVDELAAEKDHYLGWLVDNFDFPTEGSQPWKSNAGKGSIIKAFESFGIVPEKNKTWARTASGAPSFSGETMVAISEGTEAEPLGRALQTLQSQRSLAALALESAWEDGYAHPEMDALQRSGRFSMTNPSLPIWTARGPGAAEKAYFIASPGHKLVEMDLSNADQRIVAALSGDPEYIKRFEPGVDGHEVSGRLMFGDETYDSDPSGYRQIAKALSHAYAYGAGAKTLARTSGQPLELAEKFVNAMNKAYPWNKLWREKSAEQGKKGWVTSTWGRRMPVDVDRAWTMSPGLLGQAGTRDILMDGLIRIARKNLDVIRCFVASVHDAVIWDIPERDLDWMVPFILENMETEYDPGTELGQKVFFPMAAGKPSDNWQEAGHA